VPHAYQGYGLDLVSSLPLPFLPPASGISANENITVDFVASNGPFATAPIEMSDRLARVSIPGWARFEVRDGSHIQVEAPPAATREAGLFLLGAPLAALLYQRGLTVLRGGIASQGDRRVLLIGNGGVSTLLAALLEEGWQVHCDAVVAMRQAPDASVTALSGFPVLKLWRDACDGLGEVRGLGEPVRAGSSCRWVRLGDRYAGQAVTPTCIIELGLWNRDLQVEILSRRTGLESLLRSRYHPEYASRSALPRHFAMCTALAGSVRIGRLRRPWLPFDPRTQLRPFAELMDQLHMRAGIADEG
jgi:hypothetical protein